MTKLLFSIVQVLIILYVDVLNAHAVPATGFERSKDAPTKRQLGFDTRLRVVPDDYPPYKARIALHIDAPEHPGLHDAPVALCPGDQPADHILLCVSKTTTPYALIFEDILAVPGRDLSGVDSHWDAYPEALMPMPTSAEFAKPVQYAGKGDPNLFLPTNRLFEGIFLDPSDLSKRAVLLDFGLSVVGMTTNLTVYYGLPNLGMVNYTWAVCTGAYDSYRDMLGVGWGAEKIEAGVFRQTCHATQVGLKAKILEVFDPNLPQPPLTPTERPIIGKWGEPRMPGDSAGFLSDLEKVNLFIDAKEHPELDGMTVEPCNPRPWIDFPHVPANSSDPAFRNVYLELMSLAPPLMQRYFCANRTDDPPKLTYFGVSQPQQSQQDTLTSIGYLPDDRTTGLIEFLGFDRNGSVAWAYTGESQPNTYTWQICDVAYRNKSMRLVVTKPPMDLLSLLSRSNEPICKTVRVRRRTAQVIEPQDLMPSVAPLEPKLVYGYTAPTTEDFFGELGYGDWFRNFTKVVQMDAERSGKQVPGQEEAWADLQKTILDSIPMVY